MFNKSDGIFFLPISIDWWRYYLLKGCSRDNHNKHHPSLKSNFGYSLQYLEFLDYQCSEEALHYTVKALTVKTFVVIAMSVIEGLAFYLLTVNGKGKMKKWKVINEWVSNGQKHDGVDTRVRSVLESRLDQPVPDDMTLDVMIKKLKKSRLISVSSDVYKDLSYLKKLRNKIHVYNVSHYLDTDWHSFLPEKHKKCKKVLGSFLKSDVFQPTNEDLSKLSWLD